MSKTARLEEKIDGLVSLIKAGAQPGTVMTSTYATAATDEITPYGVVRINAPTPTENQYERRFNSSSSNDNIRNVPVLTPATDECSGSSYSLPSPTFRDIGYEPSPVKAEEYLDNFQTRKSKYFPFIYIPSATKAHHLQQERPFLSLCIMAVGSKSTSQQQVLGSKIRQTIAQELVFQSEKNIDLLLGLLTFIGWAHYQVHSKPFLTVFTQLAMSLVFEFGLNKPVPKDTQLVPCVKEKYSRHPTPRTMEERRAVLGCFLVTSIISSFLQKIDALRWTPHMDECLQALDERKECLNDEILVQQVRLQLLIEKTALSTLHDGAMKSAEHTREPSSLYSESIHSQLQDIKIELLSRPKTDEAVLLHLYSTELEIVLSPTFLHTKQLTLQQRKSVNAGIDSVKSWFDVFFTITPASYIGLPFSIFSQLVRGLITLYRLTTLDDPRWEENDLWKTADPLGVLDRVVNNLEQVAILAGLDDNDSPETDVFFRAAQMFRSLRPEWEAKLGSDGLSTISIPQNINETYPPDAFALEFFDNDWLMDLLVSPSY